jgi:hypothetical protein
MEQHRNGIFLDLMDHFIEHIKAFTPVLYDWVALAVCPKAYALPQLIHRVDMEIGRAHV